LAIVVLVLWLFTAGAGFYLLVTSNLGRARPAVATPAAEPAPAESATVSAAATAASAASVAAPAAAAASAAQAAATAPPSASKREMRRAVRDRFDPPSLTAAKNAPVVPGLRSLLEFAHPAFAIVGLGFWLGFTLVHDRGLGWIAFGLVTATVCLGLTWYTANTRAARREGPAEGEPAPAFRTRLVLLHGSAAAVTFVLAALTALVLSR
jgi:Na+/proline symporter